MDDDDKKEILSAIEDLKQDNKDLRQDNTIAHRGIVSMIDAVLKTQNEHTGRFDKIDKIHKAMSMTVNGERTHVMKGLVEDVEMIKTHLGL